MQKPTKVDLERMYLIERMSSVEIGKLVGADSHTVRDWMDSFGIPRHKPGTFQTGKTGNRGKTRTLEQRAKMSAALRGKTPPNKGKGSVRFNCEICKMEVFDKPYRRKRTCSKACKDKLSHINRGQKHWNYTGAEPSTQRKRLWAEHREWRQNVLIRDGFKCVSCGYGNRLIAHHLDGWANNPERRLDVGNGATLCHDCHWEFHRSTSHKNATRQMFDIWIKKPRR